MFGLHTAGRFAQKCTTLNLAFTPFPSRLGAAMSGQPSDSGAQPSEAILSPSCAQAFCHACGPTTSPWAAGSAARTQHFHEADHRTAQLRQPLPQPHGRQRCRRSSGGRAPRMQQPDSRTYNGPWSSYVTETSIACLQPLLPAAATSTWKSHGMCCAHAFSQSCKPADLPSFKGSWASDLF